MRNSTWMRRTPALAEAASHLALVTGPIAPGRGRRRGKPREESEGETVLDDVEGTGEDRCGETDPGDPGAKAGGGGRGYSRPGGPRSGGKCDSGDEKRGVCSRVEIVDAEHHPVRPSLSGAEILEKEFDLVR
jgi:hypothetical protein